MNISEIISGTPIETFEFSPDGTRESIHFRIGERPFLAVRYHGTFKTAALQVRSDTGLWFCSPRATFCAYVQEGEGANPEAAFENMRKRASETLERAKEIHAL